MKMMFDEGQGDKKNSIIGIGGAGFFIPRGQYVGRMMLKKNAQII